MAGWLETLYSLSLRNARLNSFTTPRKMPSRYLSSFSKSPLPTETAEPKLEISDSCISRLKELGSSKILRIAVDGGGCSGFQYKFELDTPIEDGDHVFRKDGICVVVDEASWSYLKGATVEYHTELIRSAFRIANNPLAEQGCSCGASFNIKI